MDGLETQPENRVAGSDQGKLMESGIDDRLSSLPDEILFHILSFMPTKYAVGTAVLSRRWTDLWTRVSSLDFDSHLVYKQLGRFLTPDEAQKYLEGKGKSPALEEIRERRELEFCRFVDRVLGKHQNLDSLRRFRLHFSVRSPNYKIRPDFWGRKDLVFGSLVEEIDVMLVEEMNYGVPPSMRCITLPESFYTLKNLKAVKFHSVIMSSNGSVSLPSVKILQLKNVRIQDFELLSRLISGCPVVETFHLENCSFLDWNEKDILNASLPSLRNLTIVNWGGYDEGLCPLVIEAPNLELLDLKDFTEIVFLGSAPLAWLRSARVNIGGRRSSSYDCLMGVLDQVSYAKEMCLSRKTLELLSAVVGDVQLPVFPNLIHLTIQPSGSSCILHSLLQSASKLQTLVINLKMCEDPMTWEEESEPACTPKCLLSSLEEIEIKQLEVDEADIKLIAYLLKAGAVLKKVNAHAHCLIDEEELKKLASLLRRLPRGSTACHARLLLWHREMSINISNDEID